MTQDETRLRITDYLNETLLDSLLPEKDLIETRKKVHEWILRTRQTRKTYKWVDLASTLSILGFAAIHGYGLWHFIDTLDFIANAAESKYSEVKVVTTILVVIPSTVVFAGLLGWFVDSRRYLGLEKPSEDERFAAKYKREDLVALIERFRGGCGKSGTELADLASNRHLFCKCADKVQIKTGVLITSAEISDTKGALAAAEQAERLELEDAEYTCLKIAAQKGSFSAAKKLCEHLGGSQERDSSSVSGWLVAAAVLGLTCA